ncbi:MAG: ABC transporter permease [Planctomycetota bacterium]
MNPPATNLLGKTPSPIAACGEVPRARGFWSASVTVFRLAGLRPLGGRRGVLLALLVASPALVALLSRIGGAGEFAGLQGMARLLGSGFLSVIEPLVFLFLGGAVLGDEIEGKTLTYLLVRPVPRAAIVVGRFASFFAASIVLLGAGVLLSALVAMAGEPALEEGFSLLASFLLVTGLAALAYGSLFLMLTVITERSVVVGIAFILLEGLLPQVPGKTAWISIKFHLHVVAQAASSGVIDLAWGTSRLALVPEVATVTLTLLAATAVFLGATLLLFRRRQFVF